MGERHAWLHTARTVGMVAFALFVSLAAIVFASESQVTPGWYHWPGFVASIAAAAGLVWRHQRPWLVFAVATAAPLLLDTDAMAMLFAIPAVLLVSRGRQDVLVIGVSYVACAAAMWRDHLRPAHLSISSLETDPGDRSLWIYGSAPGWVPFLLALVFVGTAVFVGLIIRSNRRARLAETGLDNASRTEEVLREEVIRNEERNRIARDMHDTLAASLSRISLFAGGLQVGDNSDPIQIANTASLIRGTAHQAMDDLRDIVGVLRGNGGVPTLDHTGIFGIVEVTEAARSAGIRVELAVDLGPGTLGPLAAESAYRLVREAITNVQKHAPDGGATIRLTGDIARGLTVEVSNPMPSRPSAATGNRSGLAGLDTDISQQGGRFTGGQVGGNFVVTAWLPWHS